MAKEIALKKYKKSNKRRKSLSKIKARRHNKTRRDNDIPNNQKSRIIKTFLEIMNGIKLYHWKTKSYSQHKATDEPHEKLSGQTDRFVEVLMGKTFKRINMVEDKMKLYDFDTKYEFQHKIFEFRQFLIDLSMVFPSKKDSDLMTIRDDMLESVNQFLYLLTLK